MPQLSGNPFFNAATLVLRLALAIVIFPHGAQKMLGWFGGNGIDKTLGFFQTLNIPPILGFVGILIEFVGPILLVLGLLTRVTALSILVMQATAAFMIHLRNGFFMNWSGTQQGEGIEFFFLSCGIALALVLVGAGAWAIDGAIARGVSRRRAAQRRASLAA